MTVTNALTGCDLLQMNRPILLLLLTLCCINHIGKSQLEFQSCYNARGAPTRCEPPQQSFSFERQPTANSTCGTPPDTFCLRSVSLGQISSDCSEVCDADDPTNAHPPEHMTDFLQLDTWWQSENSPSPSNVVVIDIPLKTMVEIYVISFQFQSLIPSNFRILKSVDNGSTYTDFHYFSTSCITDYSIPSGQILSLQNETLILCQDVDTPPLPGQISFFPLLERPSVNDSTPGFSESLYDFMTATNIRVVLVENYVIPNLAPDDSGYYYAIRDLNVLGSCQCHGHASECRFNSGTGRYYCACQHNTTGTFCEQCSGFYQDVPWQRSTGATEFECQACNCNGQSEECRFDPAVYEQTNRTSGGVCLNCRNNRSGRHCERCADDFYPVIEGDTDFTCTACECNLAGVTDEGSCAQVDGEGVSAGDCNCKLNTQGRTCGSCRPGFFNLISENELGCQDCECSSNGSMSESCDPISGLCPCKPNVVGERCNQCQPGFFLPDPSGMEGCQPCGCNMGGSTSLQCDELMGNCPCRVGIEGRTCSEVQDNYFVRGLDFLRLEAEDSADISDQVIITDELNRFYTGIGFYRVEEGVSVVDFGSLTLPVDGLYDIVIRYSLEGAMLWNSSTLTIVPSNDDTTAPVHCGGIPAVTERSSFEYANYMMGVGLSLTRTFCLSSGGSYQFTLSDFVSGQGNDSAALNIDSLVLIPVGSSLFTDPVLTRDYTDCVTLYRSLATRPIDPSTCRQTIFTASTLIYDGAAACNCDVVGTIMDTSCAEIGGQCDCLPGVRGRRCDQCTPGFFNLTRSGCARCDCNPSGSLDQLCDMDSGDCMCMENVNGQTCSSCVPGYWGFDSAEGCMQCDCDTTGSLTSQCDEQTGMCFCQEGVTGESCDRCQERTFGFSSSGCSMCNCDSAGSVDEDCDVITGQCSCLPATSGRDCSQCNEGTFNLQRSNPDGCQPCFCSSQSTVCSSASGFYYAQITTIFNGTDASILQGWRLIDSTSGNSTEVSPYPNGAGIILQAGTDAFLEAPAQFLGNRLSSYSQYISVEVEPVIDMEDVQQSAEFGAILIGSGVAISARLNRTESGFRVHLHESAGWVPTNALAPTLTSSDFQLILSSLTELMISASYSTDVILTSISLDTAAPQSDATTDTMQVTFVENCTCPDNYTGLSCESCASGYTRTPLGMCELCQCNGLSADCDAETGNCVDCSGDTAGPSCEVCARGFYGDPVGGVPCLPCPCPLTAMPGQFTLDCVPTESGNVSCLNCPSGHTGEQCESCISGYFGDPTGSAGVPTSCSDCQCSGNIDVNDPSSCNRVTGVCERCLNNTAGAQCERCQDGFYGDAVTAKNCSACACDPEGSTSLNCDVITGQCPCRSNVTGQRCDQCLPGFFGLGTPSGCVSCDCTFPGSTSIQCDDQGMCDCLPGVTGARCDQCLSGFFGLSASGCTACSCSAVNSDSALCDVMDGTCLCRPGSTGDNCQQCQQNYFSDESSRCTACPECYQDIEDVYMDSSLALDIRESEIQNLTSETSDLTPFDEQILQTQNNISILQDEADSLIVRQTELLVIYDDVLFAINDTLRNRITQINESLDVLKRVFTTVYVTTFTTQELMESLVTEFQAALSVVMRIEAVDIPLITDRSESIQSDSMNVSITAEELQYILGNSSEQNEELRNVTYEILTLSASILRDIEILTVLQDAIRSDVERIASTYGDLDSQVSEFDSNLTGYEVDLVMLANRLRMKRNNLVEVPERDDILYLTRNATELEAFVRNDIPSEITNQSSQLSALNATFTAQRAEFDELFQEISNLGMNVSAILELIQSAYTEALSILEDAQMLINEAEIVADNLESFDNNTFRIEEQVAEAMADIDSINRNASMTLSEALRLEVRLRNTSEEIRSAKEVANDALEIANTSFQAISAVDSESVVASANASLQSATASKNTIDTLADNVTDILTQQETLERDIADREAQVNASEATNEQTAADRTSAVMAIDQLRDEVNSLDLIDASDLQEIRRLIDEVRDEYDSAGLSNVYAALRLRLEEQRETREQMETELGGLMSDIEHLRRVNAALPTIPMGCNRGN